ncbi:MAG: hypothetical protein ACP5MD_14620 [Verrucomicrobiia bacterium]
MNMPFVSPTVLLAVYCLLALLAALAGGLLPMLFRLTHTRLQLAISFVGGLMIVWRFWACFLMQNII